MDYSKGMPAWKVLSEIIIREGNVLSYIMKEGTDGRMSVEIPKMQKRVVL